MKKELNSAEKFLKVVKSIRKDLDKAIQSVPQNDQFWTGRWSNDIEDDKGKPFGKFLWKGHRQQHNGKDGYRTVEVVCFWRTHPVYMKGDSKIVRDLLLDNSDRKKVLFSEGDFEFGYTANEIHPPTDTYWGIRLEDPKITVWEKGVEIFKTDREILLKQWFAEYINPQPEVESETFENALETLGIKINVIKHNDKKPFGRFNPEDYKPEWINRFTESTCWVVRISFPSGSNKIEFDDIKNNFGNTKPKRSSVKSDYWIDNVEQEFDYQREIYNYIKLSDAWYKEEVVWFFNFSGGTHKPTNHSILQNIFSDFEILEDGFLKDNRKNDSIYLEWNSFDDIRTLHTALDLGSIDLFNIDKLYTIWIKIAKLYNRLKCGDGGYGTMDNDGLGYEKFEEFRNLVKEWNEY